MCSMLSSVADLISFKQLELELPEKVQHAHVSEPSDEIVDTDTVFVDRAGGIGKGTGRRDDDMRAIYKQARNAALDSAVVGIRGGAGKTAAAADSIAKAKANSVRFKGSERPGTFQIVLCDLGTPGHRCAEVRSAVPDVAGVERACRRRALRPRDLRRRKLNSPPVVPLPRLYSRRTIVSADMVMVRFLGFLCSHCVRRRWLSRSVSRRPSAPQTWPAVDGDAEARHCVADTSRRLPDRVGTDCEGSGDRGRKLRLTGTSGCTSADGFCDAGVEELELGVGLVLRGLDGWASLAVVTELAGRAAGKVSLCGRRHRIKVPEAV
ncbi:hypothetical protein [Pseudoclavibacter sp. AY1F1]|uniref:hypothetical protein n=1 Tax=Pseudoclavibacter sp. AY1F1 TaxID=2080583 RepID=UPI0011B06134|nr:hypothetical protein [Pseudoclavibacter sp. AY1F1]